MGTGYHRNYLPNLNPCCHRHAWGFFGKSGYVLRSVLVAWGVCLHSIPADSRPGSGRRMDTGRDRGLGRPRPALT